jgi:hypothetical protein
MIAKLSGAGATAPARTDMNRRTLRLPRMWQAVAHAKLVINIDGGITRSVYVSS